MVDEAVSLVDQVAAVVESQREPGKGEEQLAALREFLQDMERSGVLIRRTYDLPPLDTIGRTALTQREPQLSATLRALSAHHYFTER